MLEGGRPGPFRRSKKSGILPFGTSRQQGGRISLKRTGLCEHETVKYRKLDGQSVAQLAAIPTQKTLNIASFGFQYSLPSYRLHHENKQCMQSNKKRILSNPWNDITEEPHHKRFVVVKNMLAPEECQVLIANYNEGETYRKTINMEQYRFGFGAAVLS